MAESNLEDKLLKSTSFASLRTEQRACNILKNLKWKAIHSAFYEDSVTNKIREIDVAAKQFWSFGNKPEALSISLWLLLECKTLKGYHLLFSPIAVPQLNFQSSSLCSWIGYTEKNETEQIAKNLSEVGMSKMDIKKCFLAFDDIAYPDGIVKITKVLVKPYPTDVCASSFAETNIGNEKDLDNSVLWRAFQSLSSVISSLRQRAFNNVIADLRLDASVALRGEYDVVEYITSTYKLRSSHVDIYHPVIVVDAELWSTEEESVKRLKWCRFIQHSPSGSKEWWCDVVNSIYFAAYAEDLTDFYNNALHNIGINRTD